VEFRVAGETGRILRFRANGAGAEQLLRDVNLFR